MGDYKVGKTSLRYRYLGKGFKSTYIQTVGADFSVVKEKRGDLNIQYQIWDLAGQREYENLTNLYYKGSKGFLLVYDVSDVSSFVNILHWAGKIKEYCGEDIIPFILVANKIDLRNEQLTSDIISLEKGEQLSKKIAKLLVKFV